MDAIESLICLLAAMLLLAASVTAQDPPPNAKWRLTKVNFEGLKSQPPEKMIAASGLQVGQTVDFEMIKASSQRLSQTGSGACANAVVVTFAVEEGLQYRWANPVWSGNQAHPAQELNASLALKPGDVADLTKIEKGWGEARGVYGKKGHLKVLFKPQPVFDDAQRIVTYQVAVTEGPQYRMGQVTITGLPEAEAARVKDAWGLKAGEVFDTTYFVVFHNKIAREGLIKQAKGMKTRQELKLDDQKLTVDVAIKFER